MNRDKEIPINPATITTTVTISNISIEVFRLVLNSLVELRVLQKTSDGNLHQIDHIIIEGDDYKKWGNDDTYISTFVLNKLGYTQSTVVVNA